MLKTIMSVAAGLAIGYFIYQYFAGNSRGTINGRLHKSSQDKKIAGVCGGIAEYLGIDPTIVRLAWAVLFFGWGIGAPVYILCAILFPAE